MRRLCGCFLVVVLAAASGCGKKEDNNAPNAEPNNGAADMADMGGSSDAGDGDALDPGADDDGDGVANAADNCPLAANEDQADDDTDGVGNVCDNCRMTANSDQSDIDGDGFGDVCDSCIPGGNVNYADAYFEVRTANDQITIGDVAAGDFDGDGIGDFALLNLLGNNEVSFFLSVLDPQGDAEYFTRFDTAQPGTGPRAIAALDANGDGFSELAVVNTVDISIVQNESAGNIRDLLEDPDYIYPAPGAPQDIEAADVDNDGDTDLVVLAAAPSRLIVFVNDGEGDFDESYDVDLAGFATLHDFVVAEFDQNPGADAAVLGDANRFALVTQLQSSGATTNLFTLAPTAANQEFQRIAAGSIEQNGVMDLAFLAPRAMDPDTMLDLNPEIAVWANDGDASFTSYYAEVIGIEPSMLLFADVTFDGFADVFVGSYFFRHDGASSYADGRVRVTHQMLPNDALFVNLTGDRAEDLVAFEDGRAIVLTPSCE